MVCALVGSIASAPIARASALSVNGVHVQFVPLVVVPRQTPPSAAPMYNVPEGSTAIASIRPPPFDGPTGCHVADWINVALLRFRAPVIARAMPNAFNRAPLGMPLG